VGVLIGANGSGKTTVLRGAVGLLEPIHGSITLDGIGPRRRRIAYLPQTNAVLTWRRAIDDAALLLEIAGVPKTERQELASEALRRLHFSSGLRTRIYRLSGGERQKVALARCLAAARMVSLVAIDEPTSFLDKESREGLLKEFPGLLKAVLCPVLIATHDEGLVSALPNSRFLVEAGTLRRS
jgi:taurine transport system ATP-binding protein